MTFKIVDETSCGMSWSSLHIAASLDNYLKKRQRQAQKYMGKEEANYQAKEKRLENERSR